MKHKINFSKYTAFIALIILFITMSLLSSNFLSTDNLLQVLRQISINGLIAAGMTFVILTGGIDLSVGSTLGFSAMTTVLCLNFGLPTAFCLLIGLSVGVIVGLMNGFFIAVTKLQPFIVTLAMMTIMRGLTLVISSNLSISVEKEAAFFHYIGQGYLLGIPIPVIILVIVFGIFYILLDKTTFGKKIYSIGGNEEVARLSGIKTIKTKILIYGLVGGMAAFAGVILAARLGSAQPGLGRGYELDAIAAVVIGGTSLVGGKGSIGKTFIGILIIGVLNNGLNLLGVQSDYQEIVKGVVILSAVLVDRFKKE